MSYIESLGAISSPIDVRDYVACVSMDMNYPEEFELNNLPAVKNQGRVGSCVAHSLSSIIEYFNQTQEDSNEKMSTGFIYGNRLNSNYKGAGMVVREALDCIRLYGTCPYSDFKENVEVPEAIEVFSKKAFQCSPKAIPNRITSYFKLTDENSIKASLLNNGPVVMVTKWYNNTKVINGVLRRDENTKSTGLHCMYIYGWNKDGWKISNSWGVLWGNAGRCIFPYEYVLTEAWGIIDTLSEHQKAKEFEKLTQQIEDFKEEKEKLLNEITCYKDQYNKHLNDVQNESEEIKNLKTILEEKEKSLQVLNNSLEELTNTNKLLEQQLLEIKKPFNSQLGKLIAKVINFVLRIFTKTRR